MITIEGFTFNEEAIRDTSTHSGSIIEVKGFALKTIILENSLDQEVTLQCWASRKEDFTNSFQVGSDFSIAASTNSFQTCSNYFPFMRVKATCAVAPTTGSLTIVFEKIGES